MAVPACLFRLTGTQPRPAVPFYLFFLEIQGEGVGGGESWVSRGSQGEEGTGSQESFILVVIILTVGEWEEKPDH